MSKGVIFRIFNRFSSVFCSLALFGFFALAGLNQQLNLSLPKDAKVRDEVSFSNTAFPAAEKLDIRSGAKDPATTYVSAVPVTSRSFVAPSTQSFQQASYYIAEPKQVYGNPIDNDAGRGVIRYMSYGGRFLYGHSTEAFYWLKYLGENDTFTATIDGETATYRVRQRVSYSKPVLDGNSALRASIFRANYRGESYSLALMTCGNGVHDLGTDRLIIFADRV